MNNDYIYRYNIFAKKSLGQNFLVDEQKLDDIIAASEITGKNIIEVGPGYGALTEKILGERPASLTLVELDRDMIEILEDRDMREEFRKDEVEFQILHQDVLEYSPSYESYSVIANIPYYITSPILRHFLYDIEKSPEEMLILMQKDVGDKILGKGKNKSSVLSLMIEKKCRVEEKLLVPKESFSPVPKVESSVLYFKMHDDFNSHSDEVFLEIIKKGFLAPRKKLIKNLIMGGYEKTKIQEYFCQQGYDENLRGEDLDIGEWAGLADFLNESRR